MCEGQRGQSEVQELFPRCSEQSPSGLIPVLALLTDCCGAGFTGHWAGMTWDCSDQLPWQAVTAAGPTICPAVLCDFFWVFWFYFFFILKSASACMWSYKYCNYVRLFQSFKNTNYHWCFSPVLFELCFDLLCLRVWYFHVESCSFCCLMIATKC